MSQKNSNKTSEIKKRNLLSDPVKREVCLDDLVHQLIDCSRSLAILEHKNTGPALTGVKKQLTEFKKLLSQFESRIRGKITHEVKDEISKKDKSIIYGNPSKILDYNKDNNNKKINLD